MGDLSGAHRLKEVDNCRSQLSRERKAYLTPPVLSDIVLPSAVPTPGAR